MGSVEGGRQTLQQVFIFSQVQQADAPWNSKINKRSSTNLRFEFSPKIEVIPAFKILNKHQNVVERVGEEGSESGFLKVSATKNNNQRISDKSQKLKKIRMPNSEIKMYGQIMIN